MTTSAVDREASVTDHSGRWTTLALLALASAAHQFHRSSLPALGDQLIADYGLTEVSMGQLASAFFVTYTIFMTPGGWLADKIGTRYALILVLAGSGLFGGMVGVAGWIAVGSVSGWWLLAGARAGMGVCSAPLYPSTSRTVGGWFKLRDQPWANAVVTAAAPLGMAAAFPVMSALNTSFGWRMAYVLMALATAPLLLLWVLFGRSHPAVRRNNEAASSIPSDPNGRGSIQRLLRHRGILCLALSYAAVGYYEYVLMTWLKHYFRDILKLEEMESSYYTAAPHIAMMLFTPIGGWAAGRLSSRLGLRLGLRLVPMISMTLAALFLILGSLTSSVPWIVTFFSLGMGFIGASEGPFWTAAVRIGGRYGATAAGIINTGGNVPGIIAPTATAWIAGIVNGSAANAGDPATGWKASLIVTSIVCLAGVSFWLWVDADRPLD